MCVVNLKFMMTAQKESGCTEISAPRIDATARPALATCSFGKFFKNGWLGAAVESVRLRRSFGGNRSELHKTNNARSRHRTERKKDCIHVCVKYGPTRVFSHSLSQSSSERERESSPVGLPLCFFFVLCFSCFLHLCCSALARSKCSFSHRLATYMNTHPTKATHSRLWAP